MITLDIGPMAPRRKYLKKGIEFNVMLVGTSGLGKSTLVNTLLNSRMCEPADPCLTKITKTVELRATSVEIEEKATKIRLSIIDTPGFGGFLDNTRCIQPIIDYIDAQLSNYYHDEVGPNRRSLVDNRIHCCLYFIEPMHRGLKKIDIEFMQAAHNRVNIIPLLAKADAYTNQELIDMKRLIIDDLARNKIKIYEFPICDTDDDPDFVKINEEMKKLVPFSVVGGLDTVTIGGRTIRGRKYPWGFVNVDDETHSDFIHLRAMLLRTHIHDLRDFTDEIHYENFRATMLSSGSFAHHSLSNPSVPLVKSYSEGINHESSKSEQKLNLTSNSIEAVQGSLI